MLDIDKKDFFLLLAATLEVYGQTPPSQGVMRIWWQAFANFEAALIRQAFSEHIRTSKYAPRPADILEAIERLCPDGRPSADEAWAMYPHDEAASAVVTQEMHEAMFAASGLHDKVAARMAFKDAYARICAQNKRGNIAIKWVVTLGMDVDGRVPALAEAVRRGFIDSHAAVRLLPPDKAEIMLKTAGSEFVALEYKIPTTANHRENIDRLKNLLAGAKLGNAK